MVQQRRILIPNGVVSFSLAPGETPTSLRIQWPLGAVQTLSGLSLNQLTTITEVP